MQADFDQSLRLILREEGGNDDDPNDHGGRTSRGITQREYNAWKATHPGLPDDVWKAPQSAIDAIYRKQYWDPYCDDLPAGIDLMFFNICVNAGRQQAVRCLQRALNITADGMMGMVTMNAVKAAIAGGLLDRYADQIEKFYRNLAQFPRYGRGWMSRLNRITIAAKSMASSTPVAFMAADPTPKADANDLAGPPVTTATAASGTAATSLAASVTDQLQQASTAIQPLSETFMWAKYICIAVAVIAAGLTIYAVIHNKRVAGEV